MNNSQITIANERDAQYEYVRQWSLPSRMGKPPDVQR